MMANNFGAQKGTNILDEDSGMSSSTMADSFMENDSGKKRINIFDDDVSLDAARTIIKSSNMTYGDDDDEEVNWDGTPSIKYNKSKGGNDVHKPPPPDLSSLAIPFTSSTSRNSTIPSSSAMPKSKSVYGNFSSASSFGNGNNRSHSFTIEKTSNEEKGTPSRPNFTLSNTSASSNSSLHDIDDSLGPIKKQLSAADIDKMQQDIQSLRRSLLSAKRDRWVKLPVEETLQRLLKGEQYSFEMYKSLADKLELLDKATRRYDGNAITAAVLFLKKTVSAQIFNQELIKRPVAASHYLCYLRAHYDFTEYINTLSLLGRSEEAAIFKFKMALPVSEVTLKISKVRDALRSHFQADSLLSHESSLAQEYVDLLERQRPIEDSDATTEAAGKSQIFRDFPRKRSLVDMPVVTTLYYCCFYHYDLSENSLGSHASIKKRHQISDRQFLWTCIGARAKLRRWKDIESVLTTKGWFGGTKLKAVIGFDKIVGILHRNNAPPDVLDKYLALIDDPEQRLNLAKKVSCHKAVIDTLVTLRDRLALEQYASTLDRYSKEGLYALDALNSSANRWK